MASWSVAPSCLAVLRQANERWPDRSRLSDGTIGDPRHAATVSDHNPDPDGWVHAVDLTHDPANGCDAHAWARQVAGQRDPRVRYLISNGEIWNPSISLNWREYGGSNQHTLHAHLSVRHTEAARNDTSPWFEQDQPLVAEDDDLTPEQDAMLRAVATELGQLAIVVRDPTSGVGVDVDSLVAAVSRLEIVVRDPESGLARRIRELTEKVDSLPGGNVDAEAIAQRVADVLYERLGQ